MKKPKINRINKLDKNTVGILYNFLNKNDNNSLRQCSKYLSGIIGHFFFENISLLPRIVRSYKTNKPNRY